MDNFANIELTRTQKKILRSLSMDKARELPTTTNSEDIQTLEAVHFIQLTNPQMLFCGKEQAKFKLTTDGSLYHLYRYVAGWRVRLPLIISIIALLKSFDSELILLLELLLKLLGQ